MGSEMRPGNSSRLTTAPVSGFFFPAVSAIPTLPVPKVRDSAEHGNDPAENRAALSNGKRTHVTTDDHAKGH